MSSAMANTVYVKGTNYNFIITELRRKPIQIQTEILNLCHSTNPKNWKISGESLRITVDDPQQKQLLLSLKEINGRPVEVTPPWSSTRPVTTGIAGAPAAASNSYLQALINHEKLGVIYGVPSDITCEELIAVSGA
jgi:hypothetical protein